MSKKKETKAKKNEVNTVSFPDRVWDILRCQQEAVEYAKANSGKVTNGFADNTSTILAYGFNNVEVNGVILAADGSEETVIDNG